MGNIMIYTDCQTWSNEVKFQTKIIFIIPQFVSIINKKGSKEVTYFLVSFSLLISPLLCYS